jgi:hypothetical protein
MKTSKDASRISKDGCWREEMMDLERRVERLERVAAELLRAREVERRRLPVLHFGLIKKLGSLDVRNDGRVVEGDELSHDLISAFLGVLEAWPIDRPLEPLAFPAEELLRQLPPGYDLDKVGHVLQTCTT